MYLAMARVQDRAGIGLLFLNLWNRLAWLRNLQPLHQRLQDPCCVVMLGVAVRDRCSLMIQLRTHLLLPCINPCDHAMEEIETRLDPRERSTCLLRCFPHRVQYVLGLHRRLRGRRGVLPRIEQPKRGFTALRKKSIEIEISPNTTRSRNYYSRSVTNKSQRKPDQGSPNLIPSVTPPCWYDGQREA
jgi:hypothetical protein